MSMQLADVGPQGVGLNPRFESVPVWNRTGSTVRVGEIVMFDIFLSSTATAGANFTTVIGSNNHDYANVVTPATAGIGGLTGGSGHTGAPFGCVMDVPGQNGLDGTLIRVCVRGPTRARFAAAGGTLAGKLCFPSDSSLKLSTTVVAGVKAIAELIDRATTVDGLSLVNFDGLDGFGSVPS